MQCCDDQGTEGNGEEGKRRGRETERERRMLLYPTIIGERPNSRRHAASLVVLEANSGAYISDVWFLP